LRQKAIAAEFDVPKIKRGVMGKGIGYFQGVSWERSGHHLLERILIAYFGDEFGYCEHYSPDDCCKSVPCLKAGTINLSKNHDMKSIVPIVDGVKYIIQYRD
jgi:hypothetical protein